jgi:outer membrane receptor protein involved in Fe transport
VLVGRAGAELRPSREVSVLVNVDQGFRAPNLDDLTARQETGPGFQFENPDLRSERSTSVDAGLRLRFPFLRLDAWAFAILIEDSIGRVFESAAECPPLTPECDASRTHFSLANSPGLSFVLGAEGGATVVLPEDFTVRTTLSYAWGEGPDPTSGLDVPLSRIPPLSGALEVRWRHAETGLYAGAALRWAAPQDRLAPTDAADPRIPTGGTPGWAALDLSGGLRLDESLLVAVLVENLFDVAYRVHGSSINAPGIGVSAFASIRLWPW